jgi:hypothetical protein
VIVVVVIASFWFRAMTGRQSKSVSTLVKDIRGAT